jgi:hypothetical protein
MNRVHILADLFLKKKRTLWNSRSAIPVVAQNVSNNQNNIKIEEVKIIN